MMRKVIDYIVNRRWEERVTRGAYPVHLLKGDRVDGILVDRAMTLKNDDDKKRWKEALAKS
jgi:hypothetical protein